jgi:hypothetical protein
MAARGLDGDRLLAGPIRRRLADYQEARGGLEVLRADVAEERLVPVLVLHDEPTWRVYVLDNPSDR